MSQTLFLRSIAALTAFNVGLTATQFYTLRQAHTDLYEEHEARMDELEGTLRGHIGIIEGSLERIEGKSIFVSGDERKKADDLYTGRGRDEKKNGKKKG